MYGYPRMTANNASFASYSLTLLLVPTPSQVFEKMTEKGSVYSLKARAKVCGPREKTYCRVVCGPLLGPVSWVAAEFPSISVEHRPHVQQATTIHSDASTRRYRPFGPDPVLSVGVLLCTIEPRSSMFWAHIEIDNNRSHKSRGNARLAMS